MKTITITETTEPTSVLLKRAREEFGNVYVYNERDIDTQFPAPETEQVMRFRLSQESDAEHKGKSYNDFMAEKDKTYMTMRQYIIFAVEYKKLIGDAPDKIGWTRLSSLWSDGCLVDGEWDVDDSELWLRHSNRDCRDSGNGPREQLDFDL